MSIENALKESFLANFSSAGFSTKELVIRMAVTVVLALYLFFIYRIITRKSFYDKGFNIALAALMLITEAIILAIQSSIVVSLGMVGALSIVRFRTAVKNPLDLVFLFWSIALGIICGVGMYDVAGIVTVVVTVLIFALEMLPVAKVPMLLVVRARDKKLQRDILQLVSGYAAAYKVKSRNVTDGRLNMVVELRLKEEEKLLDKLSDLDGVEYVSLLDHDGEVSF